MCPQKKGKRVLKMLIEVVGKNNVDPLSPLTIPLTITKEVHYWRLVSKTLGLGQLVTIHKKTIFYFIGL